METDLYKLLKTQVLPNFFIKFLKDFLLNLVFFFAALEQRPYLLLLIPNPPWTQVHPLRQCTSPRFEAFQLTVEYNVRLEDL